MKKEGDMDNGALTLKPNVEITEDNDTQFDPPKRDLPIRPYSDTQHQSEQDGHNRRPEMNTVFANDSNGTDDNEGNDMLDVGHHRYSTIIDHGAEEKSKNCDYDVIHMKMTFLLCRPTYHFVLADGEVFYPQVHEIENCEPSDDELDEREGDVLDLCEGRPDHEFKEQNSEEMFSEETTASKEKIYFKYWYEDLTLNMPSLTGRLKKSGKRQRQKKLGDLLGFFDTFHFLDPDLLNMIVLPVHGEAASVLGPDIPSQLPSDQRPWPPDRLYDTPWTDFRQELRRFGTFLNLPPTFPVTAVRLAAAGFLSLPDDSIVCFFCGLRHSRWNEGELPMDIHRQLRPDCPLVTGMNCDNVPIPSVSSVDPERLTTWMGHWSLTVSPQNTGLVEAAEDREEANDFSQRASPRTDVRPNISNLQVEDISEDIHRSTVSDARVMGAAPAETTATTTAASAIASSSAATGSSNLASSIQASSSQAGQNSGHAGAQSESVRPMSVFDGTAQPETPGTVARSTPHRDEPRAGAQNQVVTYDQLGIVTAPPKRPDMATINARLGTYRSWPATQSQTPMALAEAGFHYAGYADCGRCFNCGGGLKNWEPADNPWVEHARWFDKCSYVIQCQGQDFVDIVAELNSRGQRPRISWEQVKEELRNRRAGGDHVQDEPVDAAISAAVYVGYSQEDVNTAAQRLLADGHHLSLEKLLDYLVEDGAVPRDDGDESASGYGSLNDIDDLMTENNELRQRRMCKICLDREVCIAFLPCGHLVCCAECSPALRDCAMCRQRVKGRVRAFPA